MTEPLFREIFDALARFVAGGHRVTILVGNHDVELALPTVQQAFLQRIDARQHDVLFVDDGRAYRIGRLLIEHGNRYDGANENDWTGLRIIASALSRGEQPPVKLDVSPGSRLVERIVAPLRSRYPFIDLLQPQGELVALLLAAFEPALIVNLPRLGRILQARRLQSRNRDGLQPGRTSAVAFDTTEPVEDLELREVFGGAYEALRRPSEEVMASDLLFAAWAARKDSLSEILERGEEIPDGRLRQIQTALRRLLLSDVSDREDGETEQYGAAARRLIDESKSEVEKILMGHTHLARRIGPAERASYINTGTWADVIRVPREALDKGGERELQDFLVKLKRNEGRTSPATYADVRVESSGAVSDSRLLRADPI